MKDSSSQSEQEVARVGRRATNYKLIVRPLESGI